MQQVFCNLIIEPQPLLPVMKHGKPFSTLGTGMKQVMAQWGDMGGFSCFCGSRHCFEEISRVLSGDGMQPEIHHAQWGL